MLRASLSEMSGFEKQKNASITCVYRAPGQNISTFCDNIVPIIENVHRVANSLFVVTLILIVCNMSQRIVLDNFWIQCMLWVCTL